MVLSTVLALVHTLASPGYHFLQLAAKLARAIQVTRCNDSYDGPSLQRLLCVRICRRLPPRYGRTTSYRTGRGPMGNTAAIWFLAELGALSARVFVPIWPGLFHCCSIGKRVSGD